MSRSPLSVVTGGLSDIGKYITKRLVEAGTRSSHAQGWGLPGSTPRHDRLPLRDGRTGRKVIMCALIHVLNGSMREW